jgi:hypothetical protein
VATGENEFGPSVACVGVETVLGYRVWTLQLVGCAVGRHVAKTVGALVGDWVGVCWSGLQIEVGCIVRNVGAALGA